MTNDRILFDFLTFEDKYINGGALYTKRVLEGLLKKNIKIFGYCLNYDKLNDDIKDIIKKYNIVITTDFLKLNDFIDFNNINTFFIGISQRYNKFDLTKLHCKIILVCHDIGDVVLDKILQNAYLQKEHKALISKRDSIIKIIKDLLKKTIFRKKFNDVIFKYHYKFFEKLIAQPNVQIITVSKYSKIAIEYYFKNIANDIIALYPPLESNSISIDSHSNEVIKMVENKKFFLLLSADRINKNVSIFLKQFDRFNHINNNDFFAVILGLNKKNTDRVMYIKDVNDSTLDLLYQKCYALVYPSINEGFGLPPVEAMKHSKPVIAAYDTSIKEICSDSVIYFNPFYVEDLLLAEQTLLEHYETYSLKSLEHYTELKKKCDSDFNQLLKLIEDEMKNG